MGMWSLTSYLLLFLVSVVGAGRRGGGGVLMTKGTLRLVRDGNRAGAGEEQQLGAALEGAPLEARIAEQSRRVLHEETIVHFHQAELRHHEQRLEPLAKWSRRSSIQRKGSAMDGVEKHATASELDNTIGESGLMGEMVSGCNAQQLQALRAKARVQATQCPPGLEGKLGWAGLDACGVPKQWSAGAWSQGRPVGFGGNTKLTQEYQVNHPGCGSSCNHKDCGEKCVQRAGSKTSKQLLLEGTFEAPLRNPDAALQVVAGAASTCVLAETGMVTCWGYDDGSGVTQAPTGVQFTSVSVSGGSLYSYGGCPTATIKGCLNKAYSHACGIVKDTLQVRCWGRGHTPDPPDTPLEYKWFIGDPPPNMKFAAVYANVELPIDSPGDVTAWIGDKPWGGTGFFYPQKDNSKPVMACGILLESGDMFCWGRRDMKKSRFVKKPGTKGKWDSPGWDPPATESELWNMTSSLPHWNKTWPQGPFKSLSFARTHFCGLGRDGTVKCKMGQGRAYHFDGNRVCTYPCPNIGQGVLKKCPSIPNGADLNLTHLVSSPCWSCALNQSSNSKETNLNCWTPGRGALGRSDYPVHKDNRFSVPGSVEAWFHAQRSDKCRFSSLSGNDAGICGILAQNCTLRTKPQKVELARTKFAVAMKGTILCSSQGYLPEEVEDEIRGTKRSSNNFEGGLIGPSGVSFKSVSVGWDHLCGILDQEHPQVRCWGLDSAGQATLPRELKLAIEPTCATEHPEKSGPTACTSCPPGIAFTIIDPRTNTGTCTTRSCPFCKPKQCCGKHHKHFVINTESLEGVCVRHNDDCTPVCMPRGDDEPGKRRVCSKGCNQLVKVSKVHKHVDFGTTTDDESKRFDLVVCQADKRVVCSGNSGGGNSLLGDPIQGGSGTPCTTDKEVNAVARCSFTVSLWNLGGTCIANHVHGDKRPQCTNSTHSDAIDSISQLCRKADPEHDTPLCTRLAMTF